MISTSFKKQLIANAYKTQLLPVIEDKIVDESSINVIEHTKNRLLFKIDYSIKSLWLDYKFKFDNINFYIVRFLFYLTNPIYSVYKYSENENFNIQEDILFSIKKTLQYKHHIDDSSNYAEYLEEIYD